MSTALANSFKKPKSVKLTKDEWRALKNYRKGFEKEVDCAATIGVDRLVLNRILLVGSGSPTSIEKVRATLSTVKQ